MNKDEMTEFLNNLMQQEGAKGYVLINFDGIPVRAEPENEKENVQYAALFADLVLKTKKQLACLQLDQSSAYSGSSGNFQYLRMRTQKDTEFIVTNCVTSGGNEYILVTIQDCSFKNGIEEDGEEEKEEK